MGFERNRGKTGEGGKRSEEEESQERKVKIERRKKGGEMG